MPRKKKTTEQFISDAQKVHADLYDYRNTIYEGAGKSIRIICKKHGEFTQRASKHLEGQGCRECIIEPQRKTIEKFVSDSIAVHGNKYDYSKVKIEGIHNKVEIICPLHGAFLQTPAAHQSGKGCRKCGVGEVWDTKSFIDQSVMIHGSNYDYSKVEYLRTNEKVRIFCKVCKHDFEQIPASHLNGAGCPVCAGNYQLSHDDFLERLREKHGDEIYVLNKYVTSKTRMRAVHICGHRWEVSANKLINQATGCPKCAVASRTFSQEEFDIRLFEEHAGMIKRLDPYINTKTPINFKHIECGNIYRVEPRNALRHGCHSCAGRKTNEEFLEELFSVHGSEIIILNEYQTQRTKVHAQHSCGHTWWTMPSDLVGKAHGCPRCASSKGNKAIDQYLSNLGINFVREKRFEGCKDKIALPFDFFLPDYSILIEYDGAQHFQSVAFWGGEKGLRDRQRKDKIKNRWAAGSQYTLHRIRFDENVIEKIDNILTKYKCE